MNVYIHCLYLLGYFLQFSDFPLHFPPPPPPSYSARPSPFSASPEGVWIIFYGLRFLMSALDAVVAWNGHTVFTWQNRCEH